MPLKARLISIEELLEIVASNCVATEPQATQANTQATIHASESKSRPFTPTIPKKQKEQNTTRIERVSITPLMSLT